MSFQQMVLKSFYSNLEVHSSLFGIYDIWIRKMIAKIWNGRPLLSTSGNCAPVWSFRLLLYLLVFVFLTPLSGPSAPGFSNLSLTFCRRVHRLSSPLTRKGFFLSEARAGLWHITGLSGDFFRRYGALWHLACSVMKNGWLSRFRSFRQSVLSAALHLAILSSFPQLFAFWSAITMNF